MTFKLFKILSASSTLPLQPLTILRNFRLKASNSPHDGASILHLAIHGSDTDFAFLCRQCPDLLSVTGADQKSVLQLLVDYNQESKLRFILQNPTLLSVFLIHFPVRSLAEFDANWREIAEYTFSDGLPMLIAMYHTILGTLFKQSDVSSISPTHPASTHNGPLLETIERVILLGQRYIWPFFNSNTPHYDKLTFFLNQFVVQHDHSALLESTLLDSALLNSPLLNATLGNRWLHLAVLSPDSSFDTISTIIKHGGLTGEPNQEGWTPLELICQQAPTTPHFRYMFDVIQHTICEWILATIPKNGFLPSRYPLVSFRDESKQNLLQLVVSATYQSPIDSPSKSVPHPDRLDALTRLFRLSGFIMESTDNRGFNVVHTLLSAPAYPIHFPDDSDDSQIQDSLQIQDSSQTQDHPQTQTTSQDDPQMMALLSCLVTNMPDDSMLLSQTTQSGIWPIEMVIGNTINNMAISPQLRNQLLTWFLEIDPPKNRYLADLCQIDIKANVWRMLMGFECQDGIPLWSLAAQKVKGSAGHQFMDTLIQNMWVNDETRTLMHHHKGTPSQQYWDPLIMYKNQHGLSFPQMLLGLPGVKEHDFDLIFEYIDQLETRIQNGATVLKGSYCVEGSILNYIDPNGWVLLTHLLAKANTDNPSIPILKMPMLGTATFHQHSTRFIQSILISGDAASQVAHGLDPFLNVLIENNRSYRGSLLHYWVQQKDCFDVINWFMQNCRIPFESLDSDSETILVKAMKSHQPIYVLNTLLLPRISKHSAISLGTLSNKGEMPLSLATTLDYLSPQDRDNWVENLMAGLLQHEASQHEAGLEYAFDQAREKGFLTLNIHHLNTYRSESDGTLMHMAAYTASVPTNQLLGSHLDQIFITKQDRNGNTPLLVAASRPSSPRMPLIALYCEAFGFHKTEGWHSLYCCNHEGKTAYQIVMEKKDADSLRYLMHPNTLRRAIFDDLLLSQDKSKTKPETDAQDKFEDQLQGESQIQSRNKSQVDPLQEKGEKDDEVEA